MLVWRVSLINFGFILIISVNDAWGQRLKQCAGIDEYCQTHSDCCSKTCLTYLYRCTRSYSGIYPYTFFGEKIPPAGTLDDVLEFTFANAGSVQELQNRRRQQQALLISNNEIASKRYTRDVATKEEQLKLDDNVIAEKEQSKESADDCKLIGIKCYNNDECCSKRCHGFLHQCVT